MKRGPDGSIWKSRAGSKTIRERSQHSLNTFSGSGIADPISLNAFPAEYALQRTLIDMQFYALDKRLLYSRKLRWPEREVTAFDPIDAVMGDNLDTCSYCGNFLSMRPWLPPYKVDLEAWAPHFGDMAFGPGDDILVSERLLEVLRREGVTGLTQITPVEVRKAKKKVKFVGAAPKYYKTNVQRTSTEIDLEASGLAWEAGKVCNECLTGDGFLGWKRIIIKQETWDQTDIFEARGLPTVICSQKFHDVITAADAKGITLIPAELCEYWY